MLFIWAASSFPAIMHYLHILDYSTGENIAYTYSVPPDDIELQLITLGHDLKKVEYMLSTNKPETLQANLEKVT